MSVSSGVSGCRRDSSWLYRPCCSQEPPPTAGTMVRSAGRARLPRLVHSARVGTRASSWPDLRPGRAGPGRGEVGRRLADCGDTGRGGGRGLGAAAEPGGGGAPRCLRAAANMSDPASEVPEEMFREVKYYAVGDIDPQVSPARPGLPSVPLAGVRRGARRAARWAGPPGECVGRRSRPRPRPHRVARS